MQPQEFFSDEHLSKDRTTLSGEELKKSDENELQQGELHYSMGYNLSRDSSHVCNKNQDKLQVPQKKYFFLNILLLIVSIFYVFLLSLRIQSNDNFSVFLGFVHILAVNSIFFLLTTSIERRVQKKGKYLFFGTTFVSATILVILSPILSGSGFIGVMYILTSWIIAILLNSLIYKHFAVSIS